MEDGEEAVLWTSEPPVNGHSLGVCRTFDGERFSVVCDCGGFERIYDEQDFLTRGHFFFVAVLAEFADHAFGAAG